MPIDIKSFKKLNPYIIDVTHTTGHTLFWPVGMPYFKRKVRFFEVELITGGAGEMTTNGINYKTMRGDIFIRKPDSITQGIAGYYSYTIAFDPIYSEAHEDCYTSEIPYWIYDKNTTLSSDNSFSEFPEHYNTNKINEIEPLFSNIINSFKSNKIASQPYMKANILKLFDIIYNESTNCIKEKRTIKNNYEKIIQCKNYIDNNLGEKFTLEMLAKMCDLSKNFFCKIFKEIIGVSPIEYIIENRMILAKNLLITTNINIEQIATICGFDDQPYFYRIFKKHFLITPNIFREKFRSQ